MNIETALVALIREHLARRPAMQVQDVYKLLYQGVRGPEHLVASAESFMARLWAEWETVAPDSNEPLTEAVRADGALLRINLRPFKSFRDHPEQLGDACLSTARRAWGSASDLETIWFAFEQGCAAGLWSSFPLIEVQAFTRWLTEHAYPSVHHSEAYRAAYRPAYRLVGADLARMLMVGYGI